MKLTKLFVFLLAVLPMVVNAQADQKLINKAHQGDTKAMITLALCYQNGAGVAHDSIQAVKWFQKAADQGDADAWLYLSTYYLRGTCGFAKDSARYFAIRKEWAEKGHPNGLAALGIAYECGRGCKADTAKAVELYEQALKKGSTWAMEQMANNYYFADLGYAKDEKKAVQLWEKSIKLGSYESISWLVEFYMAKEDYKKAWKYINDGIRWADPDVWSSAARAYALGYGVEKNEAKAQHILDSILHEHHNLYGTQSMAGIFYMYPDDATLRDSAKAMRIWQDGDRQGSIPCRMNLARAYMEQNDYASAKPYLLKVANDNQSTGYRGLQDEACRHLGVMNYLGEDCEQDMTQAEAWWKRGVDQFKGAECANLLAIYYQEDEHRDMAQAVKYLRLADQYGDQEALATLGQLYANNGNMEQAMACFQQMIDKGQADGYYYMGLAYDAQGDAKTCNKLLAQGEKKGSKMAAESLGVIYMNGLDDTKVDYKKAAAYFEKSGSAKALYNLSRIYLNGGMGKKGVASQADIAKGLDYLQQSADQGFIDAMYTLGCFHETGEYFDTVDHVKAVSYFQPLADNDVAAGQFKMGLYHELGDGGVELDSAKAIEYYQLAADQGHTDAMLYLGDFHRIGRYLPLDQQKAFALYTQAHEAGNQGATYYVGRSYLEGCGVEVDTLMAMPYLKDAAAQGVGKACYRVADLYDFGRGGIQANGDSAVYYYIKGYQAGDADCAYKVGVLLLAEGNAEMAMQCLGAATKGGNPDGAYTYAYCLQQGIGVKEAQPKAAYRIWEQVVARYNQPESYYQLGIASIQGNGCPEDENLGKAYLDTSANLGDKDAMYSLGVCYLNGIGCNTDTTIAISWLEKCADNENINAINLLGDVYQAQGDFKNSVLYYEKGIAAGNLTSYVKMGQCYEEGLGVVLNSPKAFELYKYAADHNSVMGYRAVAHCYMEGIGVEPNGVEAINWLLHAVEAGDVNSMYYIGNIYENGATGVAADAKKAQEWYAKAAKSMSGAPVSKRKK